MFGYTALIMASQNGHHEIVHTLLEYGVDVNDDDDDDNSFTMMMMMMTMMFVDNDDSVDNRY